MKDKQQESPRVDRCGLLHRLLPSWHRSSQAVPGFSEATVHILGHFQTLAQRRALQRGRQGRGTGGGRRIPSTSGSYKHTWEPINGCSVSSWQPQQTSNEVSDATPPHTQALPPPRKYHLPPSRLLANAIPGPAHVLLHTLQRPQHRQLGAHFAT